MEVSDLPKVTRGGCNTNRNTEPRSYTLQTTLLPLCCTLRLLVLIKEWMGRKSDLGVFLHPKESKLIFSRTPCSCCGTLSPEAFLDVFSPVFNHVLRGGEGRGWVAPEPSRTRLSILSLGESNLSCPQARWQWPSSLHWPSWTGHRVSLPFPASFIPTYLCLWERRGLKSLIKGCLFCMLLPVVWGSQRSQHTVLFMSMSVWIHFKAPLLCKHLRSSIPSA